MFPTWLSCYQAFYSLQHITQNSIFFSFFFVECEMNYATAFKAHFLTHMLFFRTMSLIPPPQRNALDWESVMRSTQRSNYVKNQIECHFMSTYVDNSHFHYFPYFSDLIN